MKSTAQYCTVSMGVGVGVGVGVGSGSRSRSKSKSNMVVPLFFGVVLLFSLLLLGGRALFPLPFWAVLLFHGEATTQRRGRKPVPPKGGGVQAAPPERSEVERASAPEREGESSTTPEIDRESSTAHQGDGGKQQHHERRREGLPRCVTLLNSTQLIVLKKYLFSLRFFFFLNFFTFLFQLPFAFSPLP